MNKGHDAILVTGATGQQGGATAHELLAAGHKVYAMTRNPDGKAAKALAAAGAHVVRGDLDDEVSLRAALDGKWGVFAVQNTWEAGVEGEEEQGKRIARLAKEAGVQHFVYASVGSAHKATGIPHFDNKFRVEETIRGLDFPSFTIVRPVFFMENLASPWFKPGIDGGVLGLGMKGDTKLQMIAVADIGKYGRVAFERHEELNGQALDIAGDALTPVEAAAVLSEVTGRTIKHVQVPIEEVRKFSADFAAMLEWFDAVGYTADIEGNAQRFGVKPTRFTTWAKSVSWEVPATA
ncbi:MAG TPA: NmrA/HSCARG family protein [Longimicrobiales bacterium]|nr:NmrA/HSCARG family protein [Longimicrobiales bacterium]